VGWATFRAIFRSEGAVPSSGTNTSTEWISIKECKVRAIFKFIRILPEIHVNSSRVLGQKITLIRPCNDQAGKMP